MTYDPQTYLDVVGQIIEKLEAHNLTPVLVGGMVLFILGLQRVIKGFDFPLTAIEVAKKAQKKKIRSYIPIAF